MATATENTDKKPRVRRSVEERIVEIQKKIDIRKAEIIKFESKIEDLKNPKPRAGRKPSIKSVLNKAKEAGMTPEEIAEKLGL